MSVLFRKTNFFINFKSIFCYTDLYVLERLIEWVADKEVDPALFTTLFDEYEELGPDGMKLKLQEKTEVNFLLNYIDWEAVVKLEEADPFGFCEKIYNSLLYQEFPLSGEDLPEIQFTPLADTTRAVAKDSNIETVYIYFDYPCDYLEAKIQEFMQSNKVKIVYGNKQNFLATHTCDCYFLEDIDDICYISRRHQQRSEVIVPMFSFNVSCYDFVEGGNVELTKDGFFKDINLERTPIEYLSEYNLDIALIDIPL